MQPLNLHHKKQAYGGGGIYSSGVVVLENCTFTGNQAVSTTPFTALPNLFCMLCMLSRDYLEIVSFGLIMVGPRHANPEPELCRLLTSHRILEEGLLPSVRMPYCSRPVAAGPRTPVETEMNARLAAHDLVDTYKRRDPAMCFHHCDHA